MAPTDPRSAPKPGAARFSASGRHLGPGVWPVKDAPDPRPFGLFKAMRPASFRPPSEWANTHARSSRYRSADSADLYLAFDRVRGPVLAGRLQCCLLYTSPSPRDGLL